MKIALTIPGIGKIDSGLPTGVPTGGLVTGNKIIIVLIEFALVAALGFALWVIAHAAFNIITSGGDKEKLAQGRNRLIYAIIGLFVMFFSFFIVGLIGNFFGAPLISTPGSTSTPRPQCPVACRDETIGCSANETPLSPTNCDTMRGPVMCCISRPVPAPQPLCPAPGICRNDLDGCQAGETLNGNFRCSLGSRICCMPPFVPTPTTQPLCPAPGNCRDDLDGCQAGETLSGNFRCSIASRICCMPASATSTPIPPPPPLYSQSSYAPIPPPPASLTMAQVRANIAAQQVLNPNLDVRWAVGWILRNAYGTPPESVLNDLPGQPGGGSVDAAISFWQAQGFKVPTQ